MGIPPITPYPMPTEADLAPASVDWRPDRRRAVLLVHDMQRYFVDFFPEAQQPRTDLLANIALLRHAADRLAIPVVYTAQPTMDREMRGLLFDLWGPGMGSDPRLQEIVPEVGRKPGDLVSVKYRYSAFHGSGLAGVLADRGRDQLIVCGVFAHIGCLVTACDAYSHDVQPFYVADAVADFTLARHRMAVDYAARLCAVTLTTAGLLALLE